MQTNFAYEQARVQANLMQDKLANDKAGIDAQLAIAQGQQDFQSQQLAAQLKMASDQLAAQMKANQQQLALANAQLAQQGQLGNKSLDTQAAQAAAAQAFQQQQLAQQGQLGNRQLDIQADQGGNAGDQLDLQKWMFQQNLAQQNLDRTQKNDQMQTILGLLGGSGGLGGLGGGTGSGSGGSSGVGFTGPQGQYAGINVNTGITAGGLNPSAVRAGVSAIEGSGAANMAGSGAGMTPQQRAALAQDQGSLNFAGGQAASQEAFRSLMPQNAQLSLTADRTRQGMNSDYANFVAQQERSRKGDQLNQQGNMYDILRSLLAA